MTGRTTTLSPAALALSLVVACQAGRSHVPPYEAAGGMIGGGPVVASGGGLGGSTDSGGTSSGSGGEVVALGGTVATGGASEGGAVAVGGASEGGAVATGGASEGGTSGTSGSGGDSGGTPELSLMGSPLLFAPTATGFGLNAVVVNGDPASLRASVRAAGESAWRDAGLASFPAADVAEWRVEGLEPASSYEYQVTHPSVEGETVLGSGRLTTQRPPGDPFTFALLTDTHVPPRELEPDDLSTNDFMEDTLLQVAPDILVSHPDFMMNLGDTLDFHLFGFNTPPPDPSWTRLGYLNYRRLLTDTLANVPHFPVLGNWDGENGCNTEEEIERSRSQRLIYNPGPHPGTYPEGGDMAEDYYAFTWGDALFIVLNVMTYTPTCHLLGSYPGLPDDWTLGEAQYNWLEETLQNATSKWRFTFIHHTVGGAAGDDINSAYGRGGGQAAYVGEQASIHEMMIQYGVQIFFYGHDHVFVDMEVDGIHYTLPGSAGAPWKFTTGETGYETYWPDSGYARVDVSPETVHVSFVATGGSVLYEYDIDG